MLKDDCCHRILKLCGIPLHWKLLLTDANKLIYIYIYCFFALKKSEKAKTVAFNRLVVNYNIHIHYGDQRTRVDSCETGQKNMEWNNA